MEVFYNFYHNSKKNYNKNEKILKYSKGIFLINNVKLHLPSSRIDDDIIIYASHGGNSFNIFRSIIIKDNIKEHIIKKIKLLKDKYLCIQIRDSDLKCNFKLLYEQNKKLIHSYDCIYIATDNEASIDYFKSKNLNVLCFNTFPNNGRKELHYSNIEPEIKIKDLFTDIFIVTNSNLLLSNSQGGFITLLRNCIKNKKIILNKLK